MFDPIKVAERVANRIKEVELGLDKKAIAWVFTIVEGEVRKEFREYLEQVKKDTKEAIEASRR